MPLLTRCALVALSLAACLFAEGTCKPDAPCYSAESFVNAASNVPDQALSPMTWVSLYGTNLSYNTRGRSSDDALPGFAGVNVLVNGWHALLSYVSPRQVNFLLPRLASTTEEVTVQLTRESVAGPAVKLKLADSSPALFQKDADAVIGAHSADWTLITGEAPARADEIIILYATGLGPFVVAMDETQIPKKANPIARRNEFSLLLDGKPVEDALIEYVGVAPLFIGIYQINLRLPKQFNANPEIRISLADRMSPAGPRLEAKLE
jgi:uncharacterized protein (TIGR03437 family)